MREMPYETRLQDGATWAERSLEEGGRDWLWRGRIWEIVLLFEKCIRVHQEVEDR